MKKLFINYGMKRSGNHAILYWITDALADYKWVNNYNQQSYSDVAKKDQLENKKKIVHKFNNGTKSFQNIILSYENRIPDVGFLEQVSTAYEVCVSFIIRDPANYLVSIMKTYPGEEQQHIIEMEYYLSFLIKNQNQNPNHIYIFYEKWLSDKGYREEIAHRIGIQNIEDNLLIRRGFGMSNVESGKKVNVESMLNRYKLMEDDPTYLQLMKGSRMLELYRELEKQ